GGNEGRGISAAGQLRAFAYELGLAERDHIVRTGVRRAIVRLAIEVLRLEEQHRVVRANRGAEQSVGVEGSRGHDDAQTRQVREDTLARLAVIDGAAG